MHEWSIADNLVKLVVQATDREGLTLVSRVVIQVGVLRQVVPESLELAFSCRTGKGVEKWGKWLIEFTREGILWIFCASKTVC